MMSEANRYAREQGALSIEFGGEDGSRADVSYIAEIHREGLKAGGTRPSTPDTVGCYSPFAVREYIPAIKAAAPEAPLVVHFHNDLGVSAWNTVMALGSGAEVFTTSVKRLREERAERADFGAFSRAYYGHLEGMGVSEEEVVEIATALAEKPTA